ncbi:MAG: A/G-specific adenine glycosylase [Caldilineales bacterium]|nr:A/G-specific adenine glycosylase [Caldilineales bacterium]MCX7853293.1 A/G-specific adenine glycosylase [Caldilineales bacterium]
MSVDELRRRLLDWFAAHRRDLPWRRKPTPYRVWVSETMLQQTQVATVLPYYERFLARFPTIEALAAADLAEVLKLWEGMGYYRRAHHLHRAAQMVVAQYNGELPSDEAALLALPGIGRYTAGAIRAIAFGLPAPMVDGNVRRVLARLDDVDEPVDDPAVSARLWARAAELVDPKRPGDFNQALMEVGSTLCRPRRPACAACPLADFCLARARGTQEQRPVRRRRLPRPHYDVVAGIVWHAELPGRFLIAQRPPDGMLGGLWEFPGGKRQAGESLPQALERELAEELGIRVAVGDHLLSFNHAYSHFRITLHAYHARHLGGAPQTLGVADWRWVTASELDAFAFARTDRRIIAALAAGGFRPPWERK